MDVDTPMAALEGLRRFRLFESFDVANTRDCISRVMQPHLLQPVGAGRNAQSHMDFVSFCSIGMGTISYGDAMRVEVPSIDGYHLVMFCREGQADANAGDAALRVSRDEGMICAPGRPFAATFTSGSEQFVLRIGQEAVRAHTGMDDLVFDPRLELTRAELQPWLWQLQALGGSIPLVECAQRNPKVGVELERLLIHLLMDGQSWNKAPTVRAQGISPRSVKRAEAFIHSNYHNPIRLDDIATAADVPVRTLLAGFKRFKSCSPVQYLKEVRLEMARAQLLDGNVDVGITPLAFECGFAHLGRFARAYWERFGETPSQTSKRARGLTARA
ncbi:anthranilate 1,2-dioxygenase regulatory protein AndR [Variovorax sp. M-6]|uniref:anthranilate 1,2-dioxygenase regulatory protein AndR n=1 Tax=Variovorax sp. M-6 TaxID=3233041 RepID=UPI003F9C098E